MATLQLLPMDPGPSSHGGEVFSCAYSPDGAFVLSAGWDGHLRLWETRNGAHLSAISVGSKPLSSCGFSLDGKQWLSGALDGMLTFWDPMTQQPLSTFLAHTRPPSRIGFLPDGQLVTASWDRTLAIWKLGREREARHLTGHEDIVAGFQCAPDGKTLLSWSHDRTLRAWDATRARLLRTYTGHQDRVTAGAISPDGRWVVSGSRDCCVKLWDLQNAEEKQSLTVAGEVRACYFLLDGESLLVIDHHGRVTWHAVPSLDEQVELITRLPVQSADLSPSADQLVLGCDDGRLRFVTVEGSTDAPLVVTPTQSKRQTRTILDRLFGRSRMTDAYSCLCPACGNSFDLPGNRPGQPANCPHCQRSLRLSSLMRVASEA